VTTAQIYWGAVPFVCIQVIMVLIIIFFPTMVTHYKGSGTGVNPDSIKTLDIPLPQLAPPTLDLSPPTLQ
jgi:hypothetical protein